MIILRHWSIESLNLFDDVAGNAVWRTKIDGRGDVTLSPGGTYCFLPIGGKAVLCETMTGKAVGRIDGVPQQKFRFSPDGKRFATCNVQGIALGDTATGKWDTPFFVLESSNTQQFFWLDDRYILTDNGWVLADSAPVSIVLKIEEAKEDTASYTAGGAFPFSPVPRPSLPLRGQGGGVEVKFQPERYCLSIMQGEKEIWGKNYLTRPPSQLPLDVVKDSSLQEVIDKEMEQLHYKEWLDNVNIPKTIAQKQEGKRTSKVTENGIEEVSVQTAGR